MIALKFVNLTSLKREERKSVYANLCYFQEFGHSNSKISKLQYLLEWTFVTPSAIFFSFTAIFIFTFLLFFFSLLFPPGYYRLLRYTHSSQLMNYVPFILFLPLFSAMTTDPFFLKGVISWAVLTLRNWIEWQDTEDESGIKMGISRCSPKRASRKTQDSCYHYA
jgi:hypothetical protein